MTRKHIEQLLITGFKYFFDLDYTTFIHSLTLLIVAAGIARVAGLWLWNELNDGIQTVKRDTATVRQHWQTMSARIDNHEQQIYGYIKELRTSVASKEQRTAA